jgi:large subunit ribosomal protein LP1
MLLNVGSGGGVPVAGSAVPIAVAAAAEGAKEGEKEEEKEEFHDDMVRLLLIVFVI